MEKNSTSVRHPLRRLIFRTMTNLRQSRLRTPILKLLVWLHNNTYHLISFFASHQGHHPKHEIINYKKFFLDNIQSNESVLDVGCGDGHVAYALSQKAKHVTAIDNNRNHLEQAQRQYRSPNLSFIFGDATTYSFNRKFDVIVLSNVLEHIKHRIPFLQVLATLAPRLLIRVPMITRDWLAVYKKQSLLEYRLDDTHYIEYDRPTFEKEMKAASLTIVYYHVDFGEIYSVVRSNTWVARAGAPAGAQLGEHPWGESERQAP